MDRGTTVTSPNIKGIGIDLIEISRIGRAISRFGYRFVARVCSEEEIIFFNLKSIDRNSVSKHLLYKIANRFAAKEAFSKALGCGIGSKVQMNAISILNDDSGAPFVKINDKIENLLQDIFNKKPVIKVSLTNSRDLAAAFVTIGN